MNNKAQVIIYGLMLGLVIVILALALAGPIKERVEETMSSGNLDCSNSSISNFDKATCLATDLTLFQFVGGLIFIAGSIVAARIVFSD